MTRATIAAAVLSAAITIASIPTDTSTGAQSGPQAFIQGAPCPTYPASAPAQPEPHR